MIRSKLPLLKDYSLQLLRGDILGGVTATIVAIPIALAFGIASGLGAIAGLYGAIAVGFFAAVFGGTNTQISKPTAPMTVAMALIVTSYADSLGEAFTIVVMAGTIQVLLGISRIGRYVAYTPRVVVSGFMSGIGLIVIIMHVLPLMGMEPSSGGALGTIAEIPEAIKNVNFQALAVGCVALAIAILWPRKLGKFLPGPIVAILAGTLLSVFWLTDVPIVGELPAGLPTIQAEVPSMEFLLGSLEPALILGLLGSVDSLITSLIADTLTGTRHKSNKELIGQGIGNIASGLIGGLPCSGSTASTVTNIQAGGRTKVSGILYALLMFGLLMGLGSFIEPIPLAALAAVLIRVGWGIIDWRIVSRIHLINRAQLLVFLLTLSLTMFVDLIMAVAVGLIVASMAHARTLEKFELDSVISVPVLDQVFLRDSVDVGDIDPFSARVGIVSLKGIFSVASSSNLVEAVGKDIQDHEIVIFDFSETSYLDDSAAMVIDQLAEVAMQQNTLFIVASLHGPVKQTLLSLNILRLIPEDQIVETMEEAKQLAQQRLAV
ncbi:MAG: SulP family inorganic anion transporter [Gammaproteobacteria bacterium]|nr:SulP family inorganic anion transporter [Gammaproteobacteria bacterium]